jgi:hypothetical protein
MFWHFSIAQDSLATGIDYSKLRFSEVKSFYDKKTNLGLAYIFKHHLKFDGDSYLKNTLEIALRNEPISSKIYKKLIDEINTNERLYLAKHNFEPIPGKSYHLYIKESGEEFLSLISPKEWGDRFEYVGTFEFLSDGRWIQSES